MSEAPAPSVSSELKEPKVPTSFYLVDPHAVVREGLKRLVEADPGMVVIGETSEVSDAAGKIALLKPDIAIVDVGTSDTGGIEFTRALRSAAPEVKIVVLTGRDDARFAHELMSAGAAGFILKMASFTELAAALKTVAVEGYYLDRRILEKVLQLMLQAHSSEARKMTEREHLVLRKVAEGLTNREIAKDLGVSTKSVETYRSRAKMKVGAQTRADIVKLMKAPVWPVAAT